MAEQVQLHEVLSDLSGELHPRFVILHHSLTKDGRSVSWDAIRKYHVETNGWADIGYHFGIENVDGKHVIMKGRPIRARGAHCADGGMNKQSIGVCMVGNFDTEAPPISQWALAQLLISRLLWLYKIPICNVLGHREAQEKAGLPPEKRKSCPGLMVDMNKFREGLISTHAAVSVKA
ncbi:MAG: N-acetylmuramoyl-L-alanine amidase [Bdellovibrionaceae bacterium]|nr:N-acetylmuramoyl-L-alanine amidase [Pseudobdellovibrionaceae bacterium]